MYTKFPFKAKSLRNDTTILHTSLIKPLSSYGKGYVRLSREMCYTLSEFCYKLRTVLTT